MKDSLPASPCASNGLLLPERPRAHGINLVPVSRSGAREQVVRGATEDRGFGMLPCTAHRARTHRARASVRHSPRLIEHADADGLSGARAGMPIDTGPPGTGKIASPGTGTVPVCLAARRPQSIDTVLEASARAMKEALMTGFLPRDRTAMDLAELRAALGSTMIENRYQPIVRMADRRVIGLEALARLNHPEKGTLLPDLFVPQLEDAGLGAALTDVVSARAFADMADPWLADRGIRMSVNFPLDVLLEDAALLRLEAQREAFDIPAGRIVIELTESRPVEDFPVLRRSLDRLRSLGYGVAIDDAGPAVPRLAELLDLPFTSLKLDKELVKDVAVCPAIRDCLAATIAQGKRHGLTVVAEGIESVAIWEQMRALGVDEAQGFLVARPLPLLAVPTWSQAWLERGPGLA
jgi:EAL domain-containing protein (putative c-di-GMP-specific phosphodiesterase class I)